MNGLAGMCRNGSAVVVKIDSKTAFWFTESESSGNYTYSPMDVPTLSLEFRDCKFYFSGCGGASYVFEKTGTLISYSPNGGGAAVMRRALSDASVADTGVTTEVVSRNGAGQPLEVRTDFSGMGDPTIESFVYEYTPVVDEVPGLLLSLTLRRRVGDDPWSPIRRVVYTYYADGDVDGADGDLMTSTVQLPCGTGWVDQDTQYFRYYLAGDALGFAHALKFVCEPEAFNRLKRTADPFTAPNSIVAQFADRYFEYDSVSQRVTKRVSNAGLLTDLYAYTISANAPGYNSWATKTVTTRTDGSTVTEYYNYSERLMLRELADGAQSWITYHHFETHGWEDRTAEPSAVIGYDESFADLHVTLRTGSGLIRNTTYYDETTATSINAGGVIGFVESTSIQEGSGGAPIPQSLTTYFASPAGAQGTAYPVAAKTNYRNTDGTGEITTSYSYEWYPDTTQIFQKTVTLPAIPEDQNGSGISAFQQEQYDLLGNMIWEQGPRGFIDQFAYDVVTGAVIQMIEDVDPDLVTLPDGWSRPSGLLPPLNLVTDYEVDDRGRRTQTFGPIHNIDGQAIRNAQWTVYDDPNHRVLRTSGYLTGIIPNQVATIVNPITIAQNDAAGRTIDSIQAIRCPEACDVTLSLGRLTAGESFAQSTWTRWSRQTYNNQGQLLSSRAYFDIPSSGAGTAAMGVGRVIGNYSETLYGYDTMNRQNRTVTPGGTIARMSYDAVGRPTGSWTGTNDSAATDDDPTGDGASGNNMVQVSGQTYSTECECTQPHVSTQYVDDATTRVTTYTLDFRNRVTITSGELNQYQVNTYDNLNRMTQVDQYDGPTGNLLSRALSAYDDQGRIYRTTRYAVNPATGTPGHSLVDNFWYDEAGNLIKQLPAGSQLFTKTMYDSQARVYAVYQGYHTESGDEPYEEVGIITEDNKIFEQRLTTYDDAGNATLVESFRRFHDATGNGALNYAYSGTQPLARVSYVAQYYDGISRQVASANYGTNDNAAFTRPDLPPVSSDSTLVNSLAYDAAGNQNLLIDPAGQATFTAFDALGRTSTNIANYVAVSNDSLPRIDCNCSPQATAYLPTPGDTANVTVRMEYNADSNLVTLTACNPTTGDQVTRYEYGVTPADSDLASNTLLRYTFYPDAQDSADHVSQSYNRQGQITRKTDQNGTVHDYRYDLLGRSTDDIVTTLGTEIDGAVRRISTSYDVRGLTEKITSYSDAAGTTVVNQIQNVYNDFRQLSFQYQEHNGAVNTSTAPSVDYTYANGSANTIRPTSLVYPNGRTISYHYDSDDDDALSRISSYYDVSPGTTLVQYTYLGLGAFVETNSPQPDLTWSLITGSGSNPYASLDAFGRTTNCQWTAGNTTVEQLQYTYNRAGSRTSRHETLAAGNDELYTYDGLQRLIDMSRGDLDEQATSIADVSFAQDWTLDATGNWSGFKTLDTAIPADNLDQQRKSNRVNEIVRIAQRYGSAWAQPTYDRAGNMTTIPSGIDPTTALDGTYDAWNRLIAIDGAINYSYDGLNRCVSKALLEGEAQILYYSQFWQLLELRIGTDLVVAQHYVWGLRYIDDLLLRDRNTDSNTALDERLYAILDTSWNVTAIASSTAVIQERYQYSAYGSSVVLDPISLTPLAESAFQWQFRFACYYFDIDHGLYSVRHRHFHPLAGVWITRDPIGYQLPFINPYLYVVDSPTTFTDPFGTQPNFAQPNICSCNAWIISSEAYGFPGFSHFCIHAETCAPQGSPQPCITWSIELLGAREPNRIGRPMNLAGAGNAGPLATFFGQSFPAGGSTDSARSPQWGIWVAPDTYCNSAATGRTQGWSTLRPSNPSVPNCAFANCLVNEGRAVAARAQMLNAQYGIFGPNSNSFVSEVLSRCGAQHDLYFNSFQGGAPFIPNTPGINQTFTGLPRSTVPYPAAPVTQQGIGGLSQPLQQPVQMDADGWRASSR